MTLEKIATTTTNKPNHASIDINNNNNKLFILIEFDKEKMREKLVKYCPKTYVFIFMDFLNYET